MKAEQEIVEIQEEVAIEKKEEKLGLGRMLLWQSRSISQTASVLILSFLTLYLTETMGMPVALVGTVLMASKIFDGVTDIFIGYIVDKTNTRIGRGRPYEVCIIGVWLCTWLMFSVPPEFSVAAQAVWVFVMYTFVNSIFNTFLDTSGTVYMVRAFSKQEDYVALSSYGAIFPMLTGVIVNISFPMLMASMATSAEGWSTLVGMYALPLVLVGLLRFFTIKETNEVDTDSKNEIKFKDIIVLLKTNPYIYIIAILSFIFRFVANKEVTPFYFTHVVGNVGLMGILAATQIVILPVALIIPKLIKRFSVIKVIIGGIFISSLGYLINFIAWDNIVLLIIGNILTGAGAAPISFLTGLLIIDCANYNEWKNNPRMEGTLSSLNGLTAKIGGAFGVGALGILLSMSGFDGMGETQSESALLMIRLLYSLIPMALYILMAVVLKFYKLEKIMPQIREENELKREKLQN